MQLMIMMALMKAIIKIVRNDNKNITIFLSTLFIPYSGKFLQGKFFGNFGKKQMLSENIFLNIV